MKIRLMDFALGLPLGVVLSFPGSLPAHAADAPLVAEYAALAFAYPPYPLRRRLVRMDDARTGSLVTGHQGPGVRRPAQVAGQDPQHLPRLAINAVAAG
jgi:hypothetical protein